MATIINNPSDTRPVVSSDDSGVGMIVGLVVALVLIVLFVMYVLPGFRASTTPADTTPAGASANIDLNLPGSGSSGSSGSTGGASGNVTQ